MKDNNLRINDKLKRVVSFILALIISLGIIPNFSTDNYVKAETENFSLYRRSGDFTGSAYFHLKSAGGWSIACEDPDYHPPVDNGESVNFTSDNIVEIHDLYLKKMVYYINDFVKDVVVPQGWDGPGIFEKENGGVAYSLGGLNNRDKAYHLLHFFLGNRNKNNTTYFREGYLQYVDYLSKKAPAPANLKIYRIPRATIYGNKAEASRPSSRPYQNMLIFKFDNEPEKLNFSIRKVSENKTLTDISKYGYSLENAQYGVYKSNADAKANRNKLATLTTNSQGISNKVSLEVGTYHVKEIKAPKGFYLDQKIYRVELKDKDLELKVTDKPKFDPLNIMLKKQDDKGKALSGAEFEVKYYTKTNLTKEEILKTSPVRTWIFKTDEDGYFDFHDDFKIGGDELFKVDGKPKGLIGTYTFVETKAPKGYTIPKNNFYIGYVNENGKVTNPAENGTIYNAPIVSNQEQKGKFEISKIDFESKAKLENVEFNILDENKAVIGKLVTDENGHAESGELPLGTYLLKEARAPQGYVSLKEEIKISILGDNTGNHLTKNISIGKSENASLEGDLITISNKAQKMRFVLQKEDFITGNIPQGQNSSLENATYDVILVKSHQKGSKLEEGSVVASLKTEKDGRVQSPILELGIYDVIEKTNSNGYDKNPVAVRVEGIGDETGYELTSKVGQKTQNAQALVDIYNQKIDELNSLNKMNANGDEYRKLDHIKARENKLEVKENTLVITNEIPEYGRISITKHQDGKTGLENSSQSGERLPEANIKFDIYDWNNKLVDSIITDKSGRGSSKWLPMGRYLVKQASHKEGFIDVEDFEVEIKGDWAEYQYNLENYANLKYLQIVKKDAETGQIIPQAGVVFELYDDKGQIVKHTLRYPETKEITQFVTGENGIVQLPEKVTTGNYVLKEIKAPSGYFLDPNGEPIKFNIPDDNGLVKIFVQEVKNTPQKGRLILEKTAPILKKTELDEKTGITKLIFEKDLLSDTKWELRAKEDIYSGDKKTLIHKKGDLVDTHITNAKSPIKSKELALGKYTLKEVSLPDKYVLDTRTYDIEFTPQNQEIRIHSITEEKFNERKDVEFNFTKEFEDDKYFTRNPEAEFGLFLKEDYVENDITIKKDSLLARTKVKADVNSIVEEEVQVPVIEKVIEEINRYEVSEFKEVEKDNKDKPIIKDGKLVGYEKVFEKELINVYKFNTEEEARLKESEIKEAGNLFETKVFTSKVEKEVVSDTKTETKTINKLVVTGKFEKMPIDGKFYIKELSSDGNYVLDDKKHETGFDFSKTQEKENVIKEAKIENSLQKISLVIVKTEMGSNKEIPVAGARYKLVAVDEIKGHTSVGEFITDKDGKITIELLTKGKYYLEEVSSPEGYFKDEGKHEIDLSQGQDGEEKIVELEDEKIPEIKTNAEDDLTGKKNHNPTKTVTIKDKVSFKDLIIGKKYHVKGLLMDKATNKPLLDKKGNPYTSELEFIAQTRQGYVTLLFEVDGEMLRGKTTVVFEDLYRDDKLVYSHNDINDENQTTKTTNPEVGTRFADVNDEKELLPTGVVQVTDTVSFKDLVIGDEYELKLVVMNKETMKPLLDKEGREIVVIKKFIAESKDGQIEVSVNIDLASIRGISIVAFEELSFNGEVIASHKDIEDKNQTIVITNPEMRTKFADFKGDKEVHALKKVKLIDNVYYKDLVVGKEYELKMRIAIKGTNDFVKDKKGNDLVVTKKFIAEKKEGMIPVEVEVDLSKYQGKELVAFERLYYEGIELAIHEDINDMDQTIKVKTPNPKTGDMNLNYYYLLILSGLGILTSSKIRARRREKTL